MSSIPSPDSFQAISVRPVAPISIHTKWYVLSGTGAILAVALFYLGATRYFGEVLNPKRFALLGGGVVIVVVTMVTGRFAIRGAKEYKVKKDEYEKQKQIYDNKVAVIKKVITTPNESLTADEKTYIKTLSVADQQKIVAHRPELIKIVIEDITDDASEVYEKVKQIVNGFSETDQPKTKQVLAHVVDVLYQDDGNSNGLQKIINFVEELFDDWRKADSYDSCRFIWAFALANVFMDHEKQEIQNLYVDFIAKVLVEDHKLNPTDTAHMVQLLGKKMPEHFSFMEGETDDGIKFRIEQPTLLQICLLKGYHEVIKRVQEIRPELFTKESCVFELKPKASDDMDPSDRDEEQEYEKIEHLLIPRELYLSIHPEPAQQNPEVLALLPE